MNKILTLLLAFYIWCPTTHAGFIIAGKPTITATDTFRILAAGDRSGTTISVPIGAANTAADKAVAIVQEINRVFGAGRGVASIDPVNPARVNINGIVSRATIRSGQTTRYAELNLDAFPFEAFALVDYEGVLAGIDANGDESVFQSSFGFDGLIANASLTFSTLSGSTIDDLLIDTFDEFLTDLPMSLTTNLKLDLVNDQITFLWPTQESNYFVTNFTSDITTAASLGMTSIPEPPTIFLLIIGFPILVGLKLGLVTS